MLLPLVNNPISLPSSETVRLDWHWFPGKDPSKFSSCAVIEHSHCTTIWCMHMHVGVSIHTCNTANNFRALMDLLGLEFMGPRLRTPVLKTKILSKQRTCGSLSYNLSRLCFRECIFNDRERKCGRKKKVSNIKMVIPWDFADGIKVVKWIGKK